MRLPRALPHLNGARGTVVRLIYLLIALPTIAAVAGTIWFSTIDMLHNFPATMRLDFRTFSGEAGHYVGNAGPQAARAGLRSGDRVLAVGGVAMRPGASEFEVGEALTAASGPRVALRVAGGDGRERTVTLARQANPWLRIDPYSGLPLWLYAAISMFLVASFPATLLLVSLLLFHRRRRDPEAMLFAFGLLMLSVQPSSLWWWEGSPFSHAATRTWWFLGWIASFIAIAGFPDGRFVTRWSRITAVGLLGFAALYAGRRALPPAASGADWLDLGFVAGAVAAGVAVVLRYRRTPPGAERQQIKWAVGGSCLTLAAGAVVLVALAIAGIQFGGGDPLVFLVLTLLHMLAALSMPLGLLVSLLRYRLYDAETAISRSIAYGALTLALLAIFAGSEKLIETLGEEYFGGSLGALAGGLGAAIAAVMIVPLHHRLTHWAEHRFQGGLVRLRRGLPLLVGDLRETAAPEDIAGAVLDRVGRGARAVRGALVVDGALLAARHVDAAEVSAWRAGWVPREGEGLDCVAADPLFPMRVPLDADGCGRVGWLLLGPRPDGSFFGRDEREALAEIADPVARALAIVRQREARRSALEERIGRLEAAVAGLVAGEAAAPATA